MKPYTMTMIALCVAPFGSASALTQIDAPVPELSITPGAHEYTSGQPILIQFIVRNQHKVDIPSPFKDNAVFANAHFELTFAQEGRPVARKAYAAPGLRGLPATMSGVMLRPGATLRTEKVALAVLPGATIQGLPPGAYRLVGSVLWESERIESAAVEITIGVGEMPGLDTLDQRLVRLIESPRSFDRRVADAAGEHAPDSVYASLARSRQLLHRWMRLRNTAASDRARRTEELASLSQDIEIHVNAEHAGVLEAELLQAVVLMCLRASEELYREKSDPRKAATMRAERDEIHARASAALRKLFQQHAESSFAQKGTELATTRATQIERFLRRHPQNSNAAALRAHVQELRKLAAGAGIELRQSAGP